VIINHYIFVSLIRIVFKHTKVLTSKKTYSSSILTHSLVP